MDQQRQAEHRTVLGLLFLLTFFCLVVSLTAFLPYLIREHRRLEPWKVMLLWVGDATALFWFCRLFVIHLVLKKPLPDDQPISSGPNRAFIKVVLSMGLAMAVDLSATLAVRYEEKALFENAAQAVGQVHTMNWREAASSTQYKLDCRFSDQNNQPHETRFTLWDMKKGGLPASLPPATAEELRKRQAPFPVRVSYDPDWPARSWLTDAPFDNFDDLHSFSLCVLLFQAISVPLCLLPLYSYVKQHKAYPWWRDIYQAVPLMIEVAWLAMFGMVEIATRRFS